MVCHTETELRGCAERPDVCALKDGRHTGGSFGGPPHDGQGGFPSMDDICRGCEFCTGDLCNTHADGGGGHSPKMGNSGITNKFKKNTIPN